MAEKKKILVINGSPKKDNGATVRVTRAFARGIELAGKFETEYVAVADLDIVPCRGCLSCWVSEAGECVIEDDVSSVREKIRAADIVIESFPLYFFGMPGAIKVLTDRLLGMMCAYTGQESPKNGDSFHRVREPKEGRKLVVISSCAFTEAEDVYGALRAQYDLICGKGRYTAIFCPQLKTLVDLGRSPRLDRYLAKFTEAGSAFARDGFLSEETLRDLSKPPFTHETYKVLLDGYWRGRRKDAEND